MRTIRELTKWLNEYSTSLQTCSDHGDGFTVVYNRLKIGNECPVCNLVDAYQSDLDQATCEEESYRKDFFEASRALRETTEQLTELKTQLAKVEDRAKWRNQTIQNK